MTTADLPLVRRWLAQPHVAQWWGDTCEQFELVSGDLEVEAMDQFIVATDARPFGYIQCYDPDVWPDNGLGDHPRGTRGIDQFIGELAMVDRGHGSAFIRVFIDRPGPAATPEESVSIEDCEQVNREIGTILDVEDPLPFTYTLEVSSPGLDRPLRHADDYRRFAGRLHAPVRITG